LRYQTVYRIEEKRLGAKRVDFDTSKGSPEMDYPAHFQTYKDFIRFSKYGIVVVVAILAGMFFYLV
jgi:hypothetical protein